MRKLNVSDIYRFSVMVERANVREIIGDGLKRGAEEAMKKRNQLLRLKRALDEAKEQAERDDIMRQLMTTQKDDTGLYRVGIDVAMQVLTAASKNGVVDCIYDFLAPIFEVEQASLAAMPLDVFAKELKKLLKENNFQDFFDLPGMIQAKSEF